ncbi:uncharacterized protein LOC116931857 [Daphnia magna]|uniref:uncharacterized protein LOC116931857 n=1 Tax=Daphnia magna TaxID=35525 RepID=UPI001E1B9FDC|nr:uncharacterized protein LOC116931857 [Daphnia magna]XP_045035800.1 uncharacterized protein LOC116931857 [Daphnia magna]
MRLNTLCSCLLLLAAVKAHPEGSWKWESSSSQSTTIAPTVQPAADESLHLSVADANGKLPASAELHEESSSVDDVETAADAILHSTRTGKVINAYEAVYEDPSIQKALQEGKDTEARTYIKEKLCKLGLAKECAKLSAKSYGPSGHNGLHGGIGIDPNIVSYVQPVAIVPAGAPIAAVPLGVGGGQFKQHGKGQVGKVKGYGVPPTGYGAPSLLPPNTYGAPGLGGFGGPGLGGFGGLGGLGSLAPPPIPASLPPAPVQHIHHHQTVGVPPIIPGPYGAPPPPPPIYKSPPSYNPAPPAYNPPPRPSYSNPAPVYNSAPSRPYVPAPIQPYTNGGNAFAPRDQCVCVPVEQCPSYDVIGRVADYQIDPRSKLNSTIVADEADIVIVKQPEGRQLASPSSKDSTRRKRQSFHNRQTIVGDDTITVVSSDSSASQSPLNPPSSGSGPVAPIADVPISAGDSDDLESISVDAADSVPAGDGGSAPVAVSPPAVAGAPASVGAVGGSEEPFRFASTSGNAIRPLRSARDGPYGEEAPLNLGEVGQGLQRVGLASDEASFKTHHYEKSFKKAFGKGYGYGVPYPVATPVAVPQPYGVPYAVPQPVPVAQPYAVPQPYPVKVPVVQHVPVQVPVQVPVRVEVPVHVPVRVEVVRVEVPVPVAAPYPVPVPYEQPVQVHQHYHHQHPVPPPVPHYPPKASIYRPYPGAYGSPTYGYSGPVPSYSAPVASYGPTPYSNSGGKETPYAGQAQAHYSAEGNQPTAQVHTATGYDSITVQSAANDYTFRDSENNGQPKTRTSGVRFVDSRSGESDSSSSPAAFTSSSSSSSSAVKFEQAKRKRSADEQDFVETDASQPQPETNEGRDARQLGGSSFSGGYPTCKYSEVCCRSSPAANRYSNGAAPGTCGRRNPQGINGRIKTLPYADGEAEFAEYPWQAAILKKDQYDNVYVCGGALVGPSHILTAAHCIKGNAPGDLRVRLGEWDVNRESEFYPHIEKDVVSVIIHPEYYPGNLYNDIAIVKFEGTVDFSYNPHIAPACVPQRYQEFVGSRCWVTGWGKDAFGTGGKYQNILKEVDVPVVGNADCENKLRRTRLGYDFKLHSGFLCAGGEEGKDACKGDGGGPLVCENRGSWFLAGLVSWGVGCGQYDTPGVYTKVSEFSDWIQKNIIY